MKDNIEKFPTSPAAESLVSTVTKPLEEAYKDGKLLGYVGIAIDADSHMSYFMEMKVTQCEADRMVGRLEKLKMEILLNGIEEG